MKKENVVAQFLNKRAGFKLASDNSIKRATKAFGVSSKNFIIMEKRL